MSKPEPLEYHQPGHPAAHSRQTEWNWREPLLSPSECGHERTARQMKDGFGDAALLTQCLDCAEVIDIEDTSSDGETPPEGDTA